jgi:hypothetical protein
MMTADMNRYRVALISKSIASLSRREYHHVVEGLFNPVMEYQRQKSMKINRIDVFQVTYRLLDERYPWSKGHAVTSFRRSMRPPTVSCSALDWFEKAYDAHDPNMPYLSVDPIVDDLRDHTCFQAILNRMGLARGLEAK